MNINKILRKGVRNQLTSDEFHFLVDNIISGEISLSKSIMKMRENMNIRTVAHQIAKMPDLYIDKFDDEILRLSDDTATSVAHILAENYRDWITENSDILNLTNIYGISVADIIKKR